MASTKITGTVGDLKITKIITNIAKIENILTLAKSVSAISIKSLFLGSRLIRFFPLNRLE